jgi:hypothetical protein
MLPFVAVGALLVLEVLLRSCAQLYVWPAILDEHVHITCLQTNDGQHVLMIVRTGQLVSVG